MGTYVTPAEPITHTSAANAQVLHSKSHSRSPQVIEGGVLRQHSNVDVAGSPEGENCCDKPY